MSSINPFGNARAAAESSVLSNVGTARAGQDSILKQAMNAQREATQRLDEADGGGPAGRG